MACTLSAITITRAGPISDAIFTASIDAPSLMKCIGASICVPLCAPRSYLESVSGSPLRMSLRKLNTIGASPSYTGVLPAASVAVASIQPSSGSRAKGCAISGGGVVFAVHAVNNSVTSVTHE